MNIYCLAEGELYNIENGKEHLVHCERAESYRDAVRKMKARDEWKTTGKGAKFMGVEQKESARMKHSICSGASVRAATG